MVEDVVKRFVDTYTLAKSAIDEGDSVAASQRYQELLKIYQDLLQANLPAYHRDLAYDQLRKIHSDISSLRNTGSSRIVAAAIVIFVASLLVFIKPDIVGLVSFDQEFSMPVGITFGQSGMYNITLMGIPTSLRVSGKYAGKNAKVFLTNGKNLVLVFDSEKSEASFENVCLNTCSLSYDSKDVFLLVEIEDAALTIDSVSYKAKPIANNPPFWNSNLKTFVVNGPTNVNLSRFFTDKDGDDLVYLSTTDSGLSVSVDNEIVRISANKDVSGDRSITFMATDFKDIAKVDVTVKVENGK